MNREGFNRQNQKMTLKPGETSGRSKMTSSIVITMNLEFNSTCRRKKHCVARKTHLRLLECGRGSKFIIILERILEVHSIGRETSKGIYVVRVKTDKNSSNHQTREYVALKYGLKLEKPLRGKKSNNGQTSSQNSTMLEG